MLLVLSKLPNYVSKWFFSPENSGNFSECSLTAMKEKVEELKTSIDEFCFANLEFDANLEVEISQCGNYIGKICTCPKQRNFFKTF